MIEFGWSSLTSQVSTWVCSELKQNQKELTLPESKTPEDASVSDQIQQASWSQMTIPNSLLDQTAASSIAVQPTYQVVRDNAPSSTLVISLLIGVGVISLLLGLGSLPHHWLHGDSTRWRERKGW